MLHRLQNTVMASTGAFALLAAAPLALAAPTPYYSASGVGGLGNPQSFSGVNNTGKSIAFEFNFDFTDAIALETSPGTVENPTLPMVLWEAGATGNGAALVLEGSNLHFFAGNGNDDVATGTHDLTPVQNGVQVVSVYEIGGGTNGTDEKLSIYVNGVLKATADVDTANAWAGSDAAGLGLEQGGARTRYVGTGLFNDGEILQFPNDSTLITLDLYVLASDGGPADNTLDNILVPEPTSLALLGLSGLLVARRRR